jgi:REP element-mobilizing transposase RayT
MPKPRKTQISIEATPYYHCVSRCVRRAFLCGKDSQSGQDFEHRRQWIEDRLLSLSNIFAIDIAAYAIMSNHYHVVLHIDQQKAEAWSALEVCTQWHQLFSGFSLSSRFLAGEALSSIEDQHLNLKVEAWRLRLMDISWFMRCLNEPIARQANQEDKATGRFWEGRFRSQALLDEKALAACMAYVDLNPIRSRMAETPETSHHTSVKLRIQLQTLSNPVNPEAVAAQPSELLPFAGYPRNKMPKGLPFRYSDYLELVDWTGRILREDKKGYIPEHLPDILTRLNIDPRHWVYLAKDFESPFKSLVGSAYKIRQACEQMGKNWAHGVRRCAEVFPDT